MSNHYFHLACLLAVWALSNGESILLSNAQTSRSAQITRDASFSVNVTVIATNMINDDANDAANKLAQACLQYDTVADRENYFLQNFRTTDAVYNWNIFQHCGTYSVYTDLYVILHAVVTQNNVSTTWEFLIFASKK